jgi:trehalose/maltose hydrolase-like predicted phosphorylase
MHIEQALEATHKGDWLLIEPKYDPFRESSIESRFAVSNGFLGVRAARALSRGPTWVSWLHTLRWASWPRTYVAGLFDTPNTEPAVPTLVPISDWLRLRILVNGKMLRQRPGETLTHQRVLDMRRGVMLTTWRQRDPSGVVLTVRTLRLVSMADRPVGLQLVRLEMEQGSAAVTIEARFDEMLAGLDQVRLEQNLGVWRTEQSGKSVAIACAVSLQAGEAVLPPQALGPFRWSWCWTAAAGDAVSFSRLIAVERSDVPRKSVGEDARIALGGASSIGPLGVLAKHEGAWAERWQLSDVEIKGDAGAQRALRFAMYHLNSAANPDDERVSIGARALTGDAYLGHVFWDTEIYVLPFYVATWPEAARALLSYRFHTLGGARAKASQSGWRGAMYAWESTDTGEETTPAQVIGPDGRMIRVLCGEQEQHISADVAYAVWNYWQATGDDDFMLERGGEILLETARFWGSRATPESDGRYHIRGVIGPDEYHENVDDSVYTNVMARWNLRRGIEFASLLRDRWPDRWTELSQLLELEEAELRQWANVADNLFIAFDAQRGLLEEFAGFFKLDPVDLSLYADRSVPLDVILGRERTQRSQVVKQADVVALLALLPEECDARQRLLNFQYYEACCGHGSSLSRGFHALAASSLGETELAMRYFRQTADIDLSDKSESSSGGIHIAALGGLWQAAVFGFAGLTLRGEGLSLEPRLPREWRSFSFHTHWRKRLVQFQLDQDADEIRIALLRGEAMPVILRGQRLTLTPKRGLVCRYREAATPAA